MSELSGVPLAPSLTPQEPFDLAAFRETEEAKKLVDWIRHEYTKCKTARFSEEQRWYKNLALYGNDPYSEFGQAVGTAARLTPMASARNRKKLRINRIRSAVRTEIARLVAQKPSATAVPASSDDDDLFAAQAAEQALEAIFYRKNLLEEFGHAAFWTSITGNGFLETYWDPNSFDEDSKQDGDICYSAVTPFNLFVPNLRATHIQHQPYVLHMYTRAIDWLEYFYKEELAGVKLQPSVVSANTIMEEAYIGLRGSEHSKPDACMVYEMWIKPGGCRYLPNGGFVTLVDETIVAYSDQGLPYLHKRFPFTHFKHIPTARFYADSIIVDLEDLQKDYNDLRSMIAETRRKMGKVQIVAPKGSIVASKMTNEIGLVIEHRPGMQPPTPMPLMQLPAYILQEQDRILMDIEDLSGQHQVSKGTAPPGVTAATAIAFLQEKDDSLMSPTYGSIEWGFADIGKQTINLAVQYWDTQRLVKVVGDGNEFDVLLLQGAQLVNGTDIRVEPGSALPQSKAAKQAFVMDLMNQGHVESEQGLEMLDIGGSRRLLETLQVDKRQAQRENIILKRLPLEAFQEYDRQWQEAVMQQHSATVDPASGQPLEQPPIVTVNTWDNHEVHIEIHNRFRKTQEFTRLSDEIKQAFEAHVQMHKQALVQQQLEQQMGMIPSDGTDSFGFDPSGGAGGSEFPDFEQGQGEPQVDALSLPPEQQENPDMEAPIG